MAWFLVTAWDATDPEAFNRRMAAREAHLARLEEQRAAGEVCYALAMCDEDGKLIGSTVVYRAESREQVEAWLKAEPYVAARVWDDIRIQPCRLAPMFAG